MKPQNIEILDFKNRWKWLSENAHTSMTPDELEEFSTAKQVQADIRASMDELENEVLTRNPGVQNNLSADHEHLVRQLSPRVRDAVNRMYPKEFLQYVELVDRQSKAIQGVARVMERTASRLEGKEPASDVAKVTKALQAAINLRETRKIDLNTAVSEIKAGLKRRSPKTWSVTADRRGTSYGTIRIASPPRRRDHNGSMTDEELRELNELFGFHDHGGVRDCDGINILDSRDYQEYIDRANGLTPS
jgi:hypothetical protein